MADHGSSAGSYSGSCGPRILCRWVRVPGRLSVSPQLKAPEATTSCRHVLGYSGKSGNCFECRRPPAETVLFSTSLQRGEVDLRGQVDAALPPSARAQGSDTISSRKAEREQASEDELYLEHQELALKLCRAK